MSTFQVRIEDLIGTVGDTTLISDSLTDSAKELITSLPEKFLWSVATNSGDQTSNGYAASSALILRVTREDGTDGDFATCKRIDPAFEWNVQDPNSLYYPSAQEPVYMLKNGAVYVYPEPGASPNAFQVDEVTYPTVAYTDSAIASFPDDFEHLVMLGASIKCLIRLISDIQTSINTELSDDDPEMVQAYQMKVQSMTALLESLKAEYQTKFKFLSA